jgi:hypothetical protein
MTTYFTEEKVFTEKNYELTVSHLTNSTEKSPSKEANSHSEGEKSHT